MLRGSTELLHLWNCIGEWVLEQFLAWWLRYSRTDQFSLTCDMMAAAGAGQFQIGTFAVVERPPHHDEVFVVGHGPGQGEILTRTTSEDGGEWIWAVVLPVAGHMSASVMVGAASRRPPHGVGADAVNWVCTPPNAGAKWFPTAAESQQVIRDGAVLLQQLQIAGAGSYPVNAAGTAGRLEPVPLPVAMPVAPANVGAPGAGAAGGAAGVAGLGLQGQGAAGGDATSQLDLRSLEAAVKQLQALSLAESRKDKKDRKKGKKSKKKKKSHKKDKKKKKRRGSSSSSSSSRSRSRSSSSSSSSSDSSSGKPLRWKDKGKSKRVSYDDLSHVDGLKWKKKGDLVAFASKHPGALTAHFLAGVYARLSKGTLSRSSQLREASVAAWAHQFTGLTEIRDLKEVLTLAEILDSVNRREIERAMDILCQRILAIQAAKMKGGSWEKAEAIELVNTQKSLASTSMLALTNS